MVCDCCGRKKKLFESFAAVKHKQTQMNFCADCNDLAYKVEMMLMNRTEITMKSILKNGKKEPRSLQKHFCYGSRSF